MVDLHKLLEEFRSMAVARQHYPIWTDWGVKPTSTSIHSLGLSYLTRLGQEMGYVACQEFPVTNSIRADCVWWDKENRQPLAFFEFERFKNGAELEEKTKNLLQAHQYHRQSPQFLGLMIWTENFYPIKDHYLTNLWNIARSGFQTHDGQQIAGLTQPHFHIFEFQHTEEKSCLKLQCIRERIHR